MDYILILNLLIATGSWVVRQKSDFSSAEQICQETNGQLGYFTSQDGVKQFLDTNTSPSSTDEFWVDLSSEHWQWNIGDHTNNIPLIWA